jgi:hydrogenase maturation protein HypF
MELEALAGRRRGIEYRCDFALDGDRWVVDPFPLLARLADGSRRGRSAADLAADFHESVAGMTVQLVRRIAEASGIGTVALGGGVFQNARLLTSVRERLTRSRFVVLTPIALPPNDGGVSYGQAVVAAARIARHGR